MPDPLIPVADATPPRRVAPLQTPEVAPTAPRAKPTPVVTPAATPTVRQTPLQRLTAELNDIQRTLARIGDGNVGARTLQTLTSRLQNVQAALQELQNPQGSSSSDAMKRAIQRLLEEVMKVSETIARIARELGAEPVSASLPVGSGSSNPNPGANTANTANAANNGNAQPEARPEKKGGGLFGFLKQAVGLIPGVGPVASALLNR